MLKREFLALAFFGSKTSGARFRIIKWSYTGVCKIFWTPKKRSRFRRFVSYLDWIRDEPLRQNGRWQPINNEPFAPEEIPMELGVFHRWNDPDPGIYTINENSILNIVWFVLKNCKNI